MNIPIEVSLKRSKGRKNKENLVLNKMSNEISKGQQFKYWKDPYKLNIKKKNRLKMKEPSLQSSNTFFKRHSFQIENNSKSRQNKIEKSSGLSLLRKKMSKQCTEKEENRIGKITKLKNIEFSKKVQKGRDTSLGSEFNKKKRKNKPISSNNMGLSKILRNVESKENKIETRVKGKTKSVVEFGKNNLQNNLLKKKKSLFKKNEFAIKSKERYEQMKISKPPLLTRNNYTSHNPSIRRIKVNGILKRKMSMNISNQENKKPFTSKPNSPSNQFKNNFIISPRGFKTVNKDLEKEGGKMDFIPAPILSETVNSGGKPLLKIKEVPTKPNSSKTDNLKRILAKKRRKNMRLNKQPQFGSVVLGHSNTASFCNNLSQNLTGVHFKTPNLGSEGSPSTPLNPFVPKNLRKAKNIFSFNKTSNEALNCENNSQKTVLNNTSIFYPNSINSNKNQNSFIYLKNRIGNMKDGSIFFEKDKSSKNESFGVSQTNFPNNSKVHKSFLMTKNNCMNNKKRSKSFFEVDNVNLLTASMNFPNGLKSEHNISSLGIQNMNTSISKNVESDLEGLNKLIESIREKEEEVLSVKTIEEESELSIEKEIFSKSVKRSATLEGKILFAGDLVLIKRIQRVLEGSQVEASFD